MANTIADLTVDLGRPTVSSIVLSDTSLSAGETTTVTITFSEAVSGLSVGDFSVEGGSLSSLSALDSGTTWEATFTPTSDVEDAYQITLSADSVLDAVGNLNVSEASADYVVDTVRPTASVTLDKASLKAGETATVTITFSEVVDDLEVGDLTVVGSGAISALTQDGGNGAVWTATFTPTADTEEAGTVILLNASGITDWAGNTGAGVVSSSNVDIDTVAPSVSITSTAGAITTSNAGSVTISGTAEAGASIQLALAGTDISGATATADANGHWSVAPVDVSAFGALTATATDAAGNTGTSSAVTYTLDDSADDAGDTFAVSFATSDDVTNASEASHVS